MSVRVVITGVTGRMGSTLVRLLRSNPALTLVGGTERAGSPAVGTDVGAAAGQAPLGLSVREDLEAVLRDSGAQVVVDFTAPAPSAVHAQICASRGVALVVGSTGFSSAQEQALGAAARAVPVVAAPNFSVGVNVMVRYAAQLARALGAGFDVEIAEIHHRHKRDSPSGTALRLGEEVAAALGRDARALKKAREGEVGPRTPEEIGVLALRGGDVVGEHTVFYFGEGERLELTHRATSRDQFASGALRAAAWAVGKKPGLYGMADVLGLGSVAP